MIVHVVLDLSCRIDHPKRRVFRAPQFEVPYTLVAIDFREDIFYVNHGIALL
jgi:hypothetical protein